MNSKAINLICLSCTLLKETGLFSLDHQGKSFICFTDSLKGGHNEKICSVSVKENTISATIYCPSELSNA